MVSIQCTAYNHEKFIRETLEGFVMQKTNFRFEAIVHDDASTDGTADIIREFAEKYPDIIKPIYETENQYSKNDGTLTRIMYKACKGKYIAICEGDDYWTDPYKLQKQVDFLETHPDYVMCSHSYNTYIEEYKSFEPAYYNEEDITYNLDMFISREKWLTQPLTCIYSTLNFNLEKYLEYKDSKDVTLFYHLLKSGKGFFMKDCMAVYRVHKYGVWAGSSKYERLYADLMNLKGIHDVEKSYQSALAIRYFFIKHANEFGIRFIIKNTCIMLYMVSVLFQYFRFSIVPIMINLLNLKERILFLGKRDEKKLYY